MPASASTAPDFRWPDFDRWQAFFAARSVFPDRWDGLHAVPPAETPEAARYRSRKWEMFCEWRDLLAQREVVLAHYARHRVPVRVLRQHAPPACPVCDAFHAREVVAELDALPPYHPGCRCVAVAAHATPARRPVRAMPSRRTG